MLFYASQSYCQTSADILSAVSNIETAVMSHKYKKVLRLSDADYRSEQHDDFLAGNTRQFVDELFSGYHIQTNAYINFKLADIDAISTKSIEQISETEYIVHWLVISNVKGTAICSLTIRKSKNKWGYIGAVS